MRLREATEKSVNSVFAQLILQIGADKVVETAKAHGHHDAGRGRCPRSRSAACEKGVSPLEMASAYGTLANGGRARAAARHRRGQGRGGQGAVRRRATKSRRAIAAAVAYLDDRHAQGRHRARAPATAADIGRPAAGKTGHDAGVPRRVVRRLHAAARDRRSGSATRTRRSEMTSVHGRKVTGGSFPAEIWAALHEGGARRRPEDGLRRARRGPRRRGASASTPALLATRLLPEEGRRRCSSPTRCRSACDAARDAARRSTVPDVVGMTRRGRASRAREGRLRRVASSEEQQASRDGRARRTPPAGAKARSEVHARSTHHAAPVATGRRRPARPRRRRSPSTHRRRRSSRVTFDASASTGDGAAARYEWEFGDGDARRRARRRRTRYARKGDVHRDAAGDGRRRRDDVGRGTVACSVK